jgi:hypothetical protein
VHLKSIHQKSNSSINLLNYIHMKFVKHVPSDGSPSPLFAKTSSTFGQNVVQMVNTYSEIHAVEGR